MDKNKNDMAETDEIVRQLGIDTYIKRLIKLVENNEDCRVHREISLKVNQKIFPVLLGDWQILDKLSLKLYGHEILELGE